MELKKGMYVRSDTEGIGIVADICTCDKCTSRGFNEPIIQYSNSSDYVTSYNYMQNYEGRADFNLLNLIKVGDYINGRLVKEIVDYKQEEGINSLVIILADEFNCNELVTWDIKTIVTKEQFFNLEFNVKKED